MPDPRKSGAEPSSAIYRISFLSQGQVYEIYARSVGQGGLFGFVEVEELLFGERSQVVVDPSEERLKHEFAGVKRTYLPLHSVLRIDQVEKEGAGRIRKPESEGGSITPFPVPLYSPSRDPKS
jgi:hypothetical protein